MPLLCIIHGNRPDGSTWISHAFLHLPTVVAFYSGPSGIGCCSVSLRLRVALLFTLFHRFFKVLTFVISSCWCQIKIYIINGLVWQQHFKYIGYSLAIITASSLYDINHGLTNHVSKYRQTHPSVAAGFMVLWLCSKTRQYMTLSNKRGKQIHETKTWRSGYKTEILIMTDASFFFDFQRCFLKTCPHMNDLNSDTLGRSVDWRRVEFKVKGVKNGRSSYRLTQSSCRGWEPERR